MTQNPYFNLEFIETVIKHVIENHVSGKSLELESHKSFPRGHKNCIADILKKHDQDNIKLWREELLKMAQEDPEIMELIHKIDNLDHHIGSHYLKRGMKIKRYNEEMQKVILVMNFIKSFNENHESEKTKTATLGKSQEVVLEKNKGALLEHKGVYNVKENTQIRSLEEALLPEENMVRAIAVSILAETNGNSEIAREILSISGLKMLKSMDPKSLMHLQEDLQAISASVTNQENNL